MAWNQSSESCSHTPQALGLLEEVRPQEGLTGHLRAEARTALQGTLRKERGVRREIIISAPPSQGTSPTVPVTSASETSEQHHSEPHKRGLCPLAGTTGRLQGHCAQRLLVTSGGRAALCLGVNGFQSVDLGLLLQHGLRDPCVLGTMLDGRGCKESHGTHNPAAHTCLESPAKPSMKHS